MNSKRIPTLDYAFPHDAAIEEFFNYVKALPDDYFCISIANKAKEGQNFSRLFMI